jgi:hypothetical protein
MRGAFLAAFAVLTLALAGCSKHTPPPVGQWEGVYDTAEAMVAARVAIDDEGYVKIMAPNAELIGSDPKARQEMRDNLSSGLLAGWDRIDPRKMEFDGTVFRRPGGVAPQLEWDPQAHRMTMITYLGRGHPIRFKLHAVDDFSDDPWPKK